MISRGQEALVEAGWVLGAAVTVGYFSEEETKTGFKLREWPFSNLQLTKYTNTPPPKIPFLEPKKT